MMWFFLLLFCIAHTELVFSQGDSTKLILKNGGNPCEGHIEIYHDSIWGNVGDSYWSDTTEKVVCRSAHCGDPVSTENVLRPIDRKVWLNEMKCRGNEANLWDCENPGWGISFYPQDTTKKIKCSNEIEISLDGFKCAGAVSYSTNGQHSGYFCGDTWGKDEAAVLCKSLGCGESKEIPKQEWMVWKKFKGSTTMMVNCMGMKDFDNLWQCAAGQPKVCSKPASVICTGYERLQLTGNPSNVCSGMLEIQQNDKWNPVMNSTIGPDEWCKQMHCGTNVNHTLKDKGMQLKCSDDVKVVLMPGSPRSCYGEVHITVNNTLHPVCASTWTEKEAEVVCKELKCGKMISHSTRGNQKGIMDNVQCSGNEASLWHCSAKHGDLSCSSRAYVICANSMDVRLTDGLGKCAGRVEIKYGDEWKNVNKGQWTSSSSDVVCTQLNCGKKGESSDEFSQGSSEYLPEAIDCKSGASHISECITSSKPNRQLERKAMSITCEEHKVVFLKGDNACSGKVGIHYGNKPYWLSGSNETWNQESADTVCQQMNCGKALSKSFIISTSKKDVWSVSYSCSTNATSLFECENTTLPTNYSDTIATVSCSGDITVNLTKKCWGNVNICMGEKCGGVCRDSWTYDKSTMLCKELSCGDAIQGATESPEKSEVILKSMHRTPLTAKLSQWNFVKVGEKAATCTPAYVVCAGSVKTRMNNSRHKCFGNVELYYEGQWLPVCFDALKDVKTQKTICEDLKCGQNVTGIDFGPGPAGRSVISQIQCANDKNSIGECKITTQMRTCNLGGLQCSSWSKMEVKFGKACSGAVFVHSEGNRNAVSMEGWTDSAGKRLCQDLGCSNLKSNTTIPNSNSYSFWNSGFSCVHGAKVKNIWDCERPASPSQKQQLYIECEDEPKVNLSDKCGGEVKINNMSVYSSSWKPDYSHLVCQEQNCSNSIFFDKKMPLAKPNSQCQRVICEKYHHKLGQCKRMTGQCGNEKVVSVYCVVNVKFRTTETCGGQIEVNYRNTWEKVCEESFPNELKDELCQKLDCHRHDRGAQIPFQDKTGKLETALNCRGSRDIRHCVVKKSCERSIPAVIYCEGYVPPKVIEKVNVLPIILGVGLVLILVVLIVVFVRIVRKKKKLRMLSGTDVQFESGDYEDVTSKLNEMEDFRHGRFSSEAEVIMESDARSASSLPYDDIDEATKGKSLSSQAATAGASKDRYFNRSVHDQSSDGVTYEVDEPQEGYDDIDANPEITQTEAEVHDSPQTTPESIAAAPPGLVQGEEDYLVPGQNG